MEEQEKVKLDRKDRERITDACITVCDTLFVYSQSVLHTVQSKQHHVSKFGQPVLA